MREGQGRRLVETATGVGLVWFMVYGLRVLFHGALVPNICTMVWCTWPSKEEAQGAMMALFSNWCHMVPWVARVTSHGSLGGTCHIT